MILDIYDLTTLFYEDYLVDLYDIFIWTIIKLWSLFGYTSLKFEMIIFLSLRYGIFRFFLLFIRIFEYLIFFGIFNF